ncbi:MAG: stage III sporulation protein AF [Clostridia bacterium]|nr:stage III sporulation protein AF [Clostridia bacterium]
MENVREWAGAVCCACLLSAMLSMVFPGGSSRRILGMLVSLMLLCVLLRPFMAVRNFTLGIKHHSFEAEQYENAGLEEELESSAKGIYASYLERNLERVLDGAGISYKSVSVTMDNSGDGCISIGQVEVILKNEDVNREKVKELLRPYIGFEPEVRTGK